MITEELLAVRAKTHGNYALTSDVFRAIINALERRPVVLSSIQYTSLVMIAMKMARIVCGNPNEQDHWNDIAGYALLVSGKTQTSEDRLAPSATPTIAREPKTPYVLPKNVEQLVDDLTSDIRSCT